MSGVEAEGWRQLITPLTLAQKLPLPYGDHAAYKTPNALGPQVGGNEGCIQTASLPAFVHNFPATALAASQDTSHGLGQLAGIAGNVQSH